MTKRNRNLMIPILPAEERAALVLLSGGMDSVAALHWARTQQYGDLRAVGFAYGQPQRVAELTAAGLTCQRLGVPFSVLELGESVRGLSALSAPDPGRTTTGVSKANIPLRNLILISVAAAEAVRTWPERTIHLVGGWNQDDFAGFPDCREHFFDSAMCAVRAGLVGVSGWVSLQAPWKYRRKAEIATWAAGQPDALPDVQSSMSCYAGTRCGTCDACTLRASAFEAAGVPDGQGVPVVFGGDPHRGP